MIREIRLCSENTRILSGRLQKDIGRKLSSASYYARIDFLFFAPLTGSRLGEYLPDSRTVFLSEELLKGSASYEQLLSIALHEAAHAVQHQNYGYTAHDQLFREICHRLGTEDGYEKARITLTRQSRMLERIRKLEALSDSPFEAEAQSALLKARQLMAENSLEDTAEADSIYETDLYEGGKIYQKQKALSRMVAAITGIFVISLHTEPFSGVRGYGSHEELEVASYLWDVLERSIDKELSGRRKDNPYLYGGMQGTVNFYLGAASSVIARYSAKEEEANTRAIVLAGRKNEEKASRIVFSENRIVRKKSYYRKNDGVYSAGAEFGAKVEIRKPIRSKSGTKLLKS